MKDKREALGNKESSEGNPRGRHKTGCVQRLQEEGGRNGRLKDHRKSQI